jgi:hypothetical protein
VYCGDRVNCVDAALLVFVRCRDEDSDGIDGSCRLILPCCVQTVAQPSSAVLRGEMIERVSGGGGALGLYVDAGSDERAQRVAGGCEAGSLGVKARAAFYPEGQYLLLLDFFKSITATLAAFPSLQRISAVLRERSAPICGQRRRAALKSLPLSRCC